MFKVSLSAGLLLAILSAAAPAAGADANEPSGVFDLSLEQLTQVIFTSSRQSEEAADAAAKVYVITAQMIADSGAQSLDQVLRRVPGFQVRTWLWGFTNMSIRGMVGGSPINERLLWLVDGVPINDVRDAGIWTDVTVFPLNMIQRIEVMPGPHSSVYGSSAFQGVVSIFTKGPGDVAAGGEYAASYGRDNTFSADVALPVNDGRLSSLLAVQRLTTDDQRLVSDHSGKEVTWVRGQTRAGGLTFHYGGRAMAMKYPSIFTTPYSSYAEHRGELYADAQYDLELGTGTVLHLMPSYHHWNDHFWDYGDIPGLQYEQNSYRLSNLAQLRTRIGSRDQLTVALLTEREVYSGDDFYPDQSDVQRSRIETYGEYAWTVTDWLRVNAGASVRLGETENSQVTRAHPRLAVLGRINERLRARGTFSRAYRDPSWWHRYVNTVDAQGNPDLYAEELTGLEIGLEYDLPHGNLNGSVYRQEVEHGILEIYDPSLADPDYLQYGIFGKFNPVQAEGRYRMEGVDLSGRTAVLDGRMTVDIQYSYLKSRAPDGRPTPYDTDHRCGAQIQAELRRRWFITYGVYYVGRTVDAEMEYASVDPDRPELGLVGRRPVAAHSIHQVSVAFRPDPRWELRFGVWDLGREVYEEYLGSPQRGGTWTGSVKYRP